MTDFATTHTTPANPTDPGLVDPVWSQGPGQSFVPEMQASVTPRTPVLGGGASRPTVGLVFPH